MEEAREQELYEERVRDPRRKESYTWIKPLIEEEDQYAYIYTNPIYMCSDSNSYRFSWGIVENGQNN